MTQVSSFTIDLTEEQVAQLMVRERAASKKRPTVTVQGTDTVFGLFRHMGTLGTEHLAILTLSARNTVIGKHMISVGTADSSLAHPREVFRRAILDQASKVIVVHNHPSGDPEPSPDDRLVTKRLITAGKVIGIEVIDHVIIGHGLAYSLRDQEQMEFWR